MARTLSPARTHTYTDDRRIDAFGDDPDTMATITCCPEAGKKHPIWLLRQKQIAWCRMPDIAAENDDRVPGTSGQLLRLAAFISRRSITLDLQPHLVLGQPEIR
jgi:hypothetical protein